MKRHFLNLVIQQKGFSKRVGKVIKINDSQFKTFRKMIPNLIKSKNKYNGNLITK